MRDPITVGGHLRIRPFNTAETYPEQRLDNDLCQAVVAGNTVYLRGQVPQDLDTGENVAVGDPAGQAGQVMANIATLLAEAGAALEHIVSVQRLPDRHPAPGGRVPGGRAAPQGRVPGVHRPGRGRAGPARVAGRGDRGGGAAMTFSLVGRCERTGAVGAVIASASMAVAARCAAVRAGVGAVCSQSTTDPRLRGALLDAMAAGQGADGALAAVVGQAPDVAYRQLAVADAAGGSACYTGELALGEAYHVHLAGAAAAGNLLAARRGPGRDAGRVHRRGR